MSVPLSALPTTAHDLQARFLVLLPRVELHGRVVFRHLRCREARREAVAEMVALCWLWFLRLAGKGKDAAEFVSMLATYAARAVKAGRRLCGQERAKDVLSPRAQRRRGFTVGVLPDHSSLFGNVFDEALIDNTQTPVADQVSFRCDFPAWRRSRSDRDRLVIDTLMVGERPLAVARQFGVSPARVSQLRRDFQQDWRRFCGEHAPA
jgi:hypothetical protein